MRLVSGGQHPVAAFWCHLPPCWRSRHQPTAMTRSFGAEWNSQRALQAYKNAVQLDPSSILTPVAAVQACLTAAPPAPECCRGPPQGRLPAPLPLPCQPRA